MEPGNVATTKADDQDSGRGSLNSGSQTVICIFIPKLDVKVTSIMTARGQSNLTKGRIVRIPKDISIGSAVFAQLTADSPSSHPIKVAVASIVVIKIAIRSSSTST